MIGIPSIEGLETRKVRNREEMVIARHLHARCYLAAGYARPDDLDVDGFLADQWVDYSDYYVAVEKESAEIVGTCRIIRPSVQGFPLFRFFDLDDHAKQVFAHLDPNLCGEVSALATTREGLQNTTISAALYALVWHEFLTRGYAYMLAIMDPQLLRIMRRFLHFPFESLGPSSHFMGDQTAPVTMYLPRTIEDFRVRSPELLDRFSGGLTFAEIADIELDLRDQAPEFRSLPAASWSATLEPPLRT